MSFSFFNWRVPVLSRCNLVGSSTLHAIARFSGFTLEIPRTIPRRQSLNACWFQQQPEKQQLLWINHASTGSAPTQRHAALCVDESINRQWCTWTHNVTICLMILLTLRCSAHLLIYLTHDDKSAHAHTHTWIFMLSEHWMSKEVQRVLSLQGEHWLYSDGDVTVLLRSGWCRGTAAAFLALTLSLSYLHFNTITYTCTLSNTQNICFNGRNPLPTLCHPVRGLQWHPKLFIGLSGLH